MSDAPKPRTAEEWARLLECESDGCSRPVKYVWTPTSGGAPRRECFECHHTIIDDGPGMYQSFGRKDELLRILRDAMAQARAAGAAEAEVRRAKLRALGVDP